ncbi:hypothetical protein HEP85_38900 [Streptomyces sp. RPA4-2]|nr:hypothetical protein [Streptomyces sp. RPA4-2]QIY66412.1 hypothetical protein HEP85_38900 [Streptomyces sp. RPA4-2]
MTTGIKIRAAAYLFAWAKRRAKPAVEGGTQADAAVNLVMDRLHDALEE